MKNANQFATLRITGMATVPSPGKLAFGSCEIDVPEDAPVESGVYDVTATVYKDRIVANRVGRLVSLSAFKEVLSDGFEQAPKPVTPPPATVAPVTAPPAAPKAETAPPAAATRPAAAATAAPTAPAPVATAVTEPAKPVEPPVKTGGMSSSLSALLNRKPSHAPAAPKPPASVENVKVPAEADARASRPPFVPGKQLGDVEF